MRQRTAPARCLSVLVRRRGENQHRLCSAGAHRWAPAITVQASELLARVPRSVLDLLDDLIKVPALGALKRRKLFVALQLLEPQLLANRENVPVVYPRRDRPRDRTGERKRSRLVPFACRNLKWIALEVDNAGHELGLDSRDVEACRGFGRDREIQLPVFVAHCRRTRTGIVEEGVACGFFALSQQVVGLIDTIEGGLDDPRVTARLDLLLQSVTFRSASDVDERRQPVERGKDPALEGARPDLTRPADDQWRT